MKNTLFNPGIDNQFADGNMEAAREKFIEDSRFAKTVDTKDGKALLIGGAVINVVSAAYPGLHADWLSVALRRRAGDASSSKGG